MGKEIQTSRSFLICVWYTLCVEKEDREFAAATGNGMRHAKLHILNHTDMQYGT